MGKTKEEPQLSAAEITDLLHMYSVSFLTVTKQSIYHLVSQMLRTVGEDEYVDAVENFIEVWEDNE
jgi:hypothetical protein